MAPTPRRFSGAAPGIFLCWSQADPVGEWVNSWGGIMVSIHPWTLMNNHMFSWGKHTHTYYFWLLNNQLDVDNYWPYCFFQNLKAEEPLKKTPVDHPSCYQDYHFMGKSFQRYPVHFPKKYHGSWVSPVLQPAPTAFFIWKSVFHILSWA